MTAIDSKRSFFMKRIALFLVCSAFALTALAADDFKNVQELKGISPAEMQRTMALIRASLGVNCDTCHVRKGDEMDFASDDKQEKKTARSMIKMTKELNKTYFDGHLGVACNTCHRGSEHPVSLPALPQMAAAEENETPRPKRPPVAEIVAAYSKAIGATDKTAIESFSAKGTREAGGKSAPIETAQRGDMIRVSMTTPKGTMENRFNGTTGTTQMADGTSREMFPWEANNLRSTASAFEFVTPKDIPADARVGSDKVGAQEAWVVTYPAGPDMVQRLYFDKSSGLLLRRTLLATTQVGRVPQQTDYEDYREVGNGLKLPFTMKTEFVDPRQDAVRKYTEVKVNPKLDDSLFGVK
jgi:hypothetical protein